MFYLCKFTVPFVGEHFPQRALTPICLSRFLHAPQRQAWSEQNMLVFKCQDGRINNLPFLCRSAFFNKEKDKSIYVFILVLISWST